MWLVYLRFDHGHETKTYHVTAGNKIEAENILALAEKRGLRVFGQAGAKVKDEVLACGCVGGCRE
jgi:hypothetical protein